MIRFSMKSHPQLKAGLSRMCWSKAWVSMKAMRCEKGNEKEVVRRKR